MRVFEIVGPIMFGPSASHTACACRLSRAMYQLADRQIDEAHLQLHGSFRVKEDGRINKALVAGLLGMDTDDDRINDSYACMRRSKIKFSYENVELEHAHNNTVRYIIKNKKIAFTATGVSVGGGMIEIRDINGVPVLITGENHTIVIFAEDDTAVRNFLTGNGDAEGRLSVFPLDDAQKLMLYQTEFSIDLQFLLEIRKLAGVAYASLLERFE